VLTLFPTGVLPVLHSRSTLQLVALRSGFGVSAEQSAETDGFGELS